jgi:hypothetical protein
VNERCVGERPESLGYGTIAVLGGVLVPQSGAGVGMTAAAHQLGD